ncbi:MAG: transcription termination factor Rho [Bacteroidota bacterium]|nr:transcription termination factor Rho [Bacteroidota bacterium]
MKTINTQNILPQLSSEKYFTGILEIVRSNKNVKHYFSPVGRLIKISVELEQDYDSPIVNGKLIKQFNLRQGVLLDCKVQKRSGILEVEEILTVNGLLPEEWLKCEEFQTGTAVDASEQIVLTTEPNEYSLRIFDLLCPIGKGQRALIVAPPKAGKTILLKQIAKSIGTNHPDISLIVLLVDERPEEVTDFRRSVNAKVFASSSDSSRESHVRIASLVLDYAKREVETGKDVVLLIDSLTKMGRAFNAFQPGSGRTMSGGVDIRALEIPKKIFGSARALEDRGSLTIIATILVDTNSRMDELIFQEFKGTGNMELVLNRELANHRIFPAINIQESGTRREELLFGRHTEKHYALRRLLNNLKPKEAMLNMIKLLDMYSTNRKLLSKISKTTLDDNES